MNDQIAQPGKTELEEAARQLTSYFVPHIESELTGFDDGIKVKVEYMPNDIAEHMQMWHLVVKYDLLDLSAAMSISENLLQYTSNDSIGVRLSDGRLATLGDGDDLGAAWLEGNTFRVWLRVWAVGREYGFGNDE